MKSVLTWALITMAIGLMGGCDDQSQEAQVVTDVESDHCAWTAAGELSVVADLQERLDAYVVTDLSPDMSGLSESQRQVVDKLVAAAQVMDEIFKIQSTPCRDELVARVAELPADQRAGVERYMRINVGPWDRRFHFEPFFGQWEYPAGANYYPLELSEAEKAHISDPANGLDGLMTMIRRRDGALVAIPYSEFFAEQLDRAATLLREAAALTENTSLKAYLVARADAFLSDDYYESDMLWMDLDGAIEVTIGREDHPRHLALFGHAFSHRIGLLQPLLSSGGATRRQVVQGGQYRRVIRGLGWLQNLTGAASIGNDGHLILFGKFGQHQRQALLEQGQLVSALHRAGGVDQEHQIQWRTVFDNRIAALNGDMHQLRIRVPGGAGHGHCGTERGTVGVGSQVVIGEIVDHFLDPHRAVGRQLASHQGRADDRIRRRVDVDGKGRHRGFSGDFQGVGFGVRVGLGI